MVIFDPKQFDRAFRPVAEGRAFYPWMALRTGYVVDAAAEAALRRVLGRWQRISVFVIFPLVFVFSWLVLHTLVYWQILYFLHPMDVTGLAVLAAVAGRVADIPLLASVRLRGCPRTVGRISYAATIDARAG